MDILASDSARFSQTKKFKIMTIFRKFTYYNLNKNRFYMPTLISYRMYIINNEQYCQEG